MTGKIQKQKNDMKELLAKVDLSTEDKVRLIDEAVAEEFAANQKFLETFKVSLEAFRGFYQLHTLYGNIDRRADKKFTEALSKNIAKFQQEKALERRK